MANVKITDLAAYTDPASTDVLPIVDVGADVTKKVSIADLLENAGSGTESLPGIAFDGDPNTGIYSPGADQIAISTDGSQRVCIDSSGRLLVSTSTSRVVGAVQALSQIETTSSAAGISIVRHSNDVGQGRITFAKTRGTSNGASTLVSNNDNLGTIEFAGGDGTDIVSLGASITAAIDGTPGTDDMPCRLVFSVTADGSASPTERMRLDNQGRLGLQSTLSTLEVSTTQAAGTVFSNIFCRHSATDGSIGTGTLSFRVYSNGDVQNTNNSYGAISDIKLKENIVDANSQWDDLKTLQVRKYNFKPETGHGTHTQIGLIAQEVELVSPGLVGESIDEETGESTKSVNYSVLYMKAVKALQEAMERIEVLEQRLTDAGIA